MQKFKNQQSEKPTESLSNGGLSEDNLFNVQELNSPRREIKNN